MIIRTSTSFADFKACEDIQKEVWGFEDRDVVPSHLLKALSDPLTPWSILLGCFDQDELIGFAFCLHTSEPKTLLLHMLAILPKKQGLGIGFSLMKEVAQKLVEQGYPNLVWTFDPLESANAHLYFHKLGAKVIEYTEDYYPPNSSTLHSGQIPSDRLKMKWDCERFLTQGIQNQIRNEEDVKIEIPGNFQEIKKQDVDLAYKIRISTRQKFQDCLKSQSMSNIDYVYNKNQNVRQYYFKKMV